MSPSPARLAIEAAVGALGGALVARVLPQGEVGIVFFVLVGGLGAPAALLLTPSVGPLAYRAVRYGASLAILVALVVSFWFGTDGVSGPGLLAIAVLVFAIGAVGHAVMAAALPPSMGAASTGDPDGQ